MALTLPYEFANVGLKTPTAQLDANFQAVADWLNTHGGVVGTVAARPAPTAVGALYVATDQNNLWYMADGTTWHPIGRAGTGTLDVDPLTGNVRLFGAAVGAGAQRVLSLGLATGIPTSSPPGLAQLYVADTQGLADRAAWHQRTEDGWAQPLDRVLQRAVFATPLTVVNTAAETSLVAFPLQAGTLALGGLDGATPRGIGLALGLDALNNAGATRTLTLRVKLGGATGLIAVLTLPNSATRRKGAVQYRIDPVGTTSAWSHTLSQWEPPPTETVTANFLDVTITAPLTLEVTAQWSLASALSDVRLWTAGVVQT